MRARIRGQAAYRRRLAILVLAIAGSGRAGGEAGAQPPAPPPPAAPASTAAAPARPVAPAAAVPRGTVRTDSLRSAALGAWKRYVVYLPPSYRDSVRRFPVAYYLHGLYGAEGDWTRAGRLAETLDSLVALGMPELVVVMPDGDDGWYTTWARPADPAACRAVQREEPPEHHCVEQARYDDYVAGDLVRHVDGRYRTLAARAHRGIAGLSMGGYGAVTLALRHPELFSAAASHSGTLSMLHRPAADSTTPPGAAYAADSAELAGIWGGMWPRVVPAFGGDTADWWARDPARLLERARREGRGALPRLFLDVGRADPLAHQTYDFHRALVRLGVPHEYAVRDGAHDWTYWRRRAAASLWWLAAGL
jgi:S-formylglutathione hydrolase FrmB